MLHFEGGCTLEIMSRTDVDQVRNSEDREFIGFAHLACSTGSKDQVDRLTERLRQAGNKGMKYIHHSILQVVLYKSHQAVSVVFETMALLIMLHIIFHSFSF